MTSDRPGATVANVATARNSVGATNISAGLVRMAFSTACATSTGDLVRTPLGSSTSLLANMPASRMKPGSTTVTPMPYSSRSWRSDSPKPLRPNFVALYRQVSGVGAMPDSDPISTSCPGRSAAMQAWAKAPLSTIGARRLTSIAPSIALTLSSEPLASPPTPALAITTSNSPTILASRCTSLRLDRSASTTVPRVSSASESRAGRLRAVSVN